MDHQKKLDFVLKMTRHGLDSVQHFDTGGKVGSALGGALGGAGTGAAIGSVVPGIGTAIGAVGGAIVGGLSSILSSQDSAQLPNIVDPVTGQQITDAAGRVVATQQQLDTYSKNLAAQHGIQNQSDVYNRYGEIASGRGPNPAQAALNQQTGQNIEQQAALAAGTRGAGTNAGLIAENAARQGAATQQQAVGQSATLQAEQELAALGAQSGIAQNQVSNLGNALATGSTAALNNQGQVLGAAGTYNSDLTSGQGSVNSANTPLNVGAQSEGNTLINGGLSGAGTALGLMKSPTSGSTPSVAASPAKIPAPGVAPASTGFAYGGKIPDHLQKMAEIYHPHMIGKIASYQSGGKVPGKPIVNRDALKNDTVTAKLSPGEVVIDLNTLHDKGKLGKMARFVAQNIERKKMGRAC